MIPANPEICGRKVLDGLVDYISLLYHEARNVRFLVRAKHVDADRFSGVLQLAQNRNEAWAQLGELRRQAKKLNRAAQIEAVYVRRFGLDLNGLAELFGHPGWRGSARGGNAWATISAQVISLRDALAERDIDSAIRLNRDIGESSHNTGLVKDKVRGLDSGDY